MQAFEACRASYCRANGNDFHSWEAMEGGMATQGVNRQLAGGTGRLRVREEEGEKVWGKRQQCEMVT